MWYQAMFIYYNVWLGIIFGIKFGYMSILLNNIIYTVARVHIL